MSCHLAGGVHTSKRSPSISSLYSRTHFRRMSISLRRGLMTLTTRQRELKRSRNSPTAPGRLFAFDDWDENESVFFDCVTAYIWR